MVSTGTGVPVPYPVPVQVLPAVLWYGNRTIYQTGTTAEAVAARAGSNRLRKSDYADLFSGT